MQQSYAATRLGIAETAEFSDMDDDLARALCQHEAVNIRYLILMQLTDGEVAWGPRTAVQIAGGLVEDGASSALLVDPVFLARLDGVCREMVGEGYLEVRRVRPPRRYPRNPTPHLHRVSRDVPEIAGSSGGATAKETDQ